MDISKNTIIGSVSIIIGGMIYVLWREQTLLMFSWFNSMGVMDAIEAMRYSASPYHSIVPKWIYFSLPNAMWLLGGTLLFSSIWKDHVYERYFWMTLFSIIAIGSELGQLTDFINRLYSWGI